MSVIESIISDISGLTPATILLMAVAGLLVGVSPGSYPLLAAGAGLSAGAYPAGSPLSRNRNVYLAVGFVLGIAFVDAVIGALFGLFGFVVLRALAPILAYAYFFLSLILFFLGLALLRLIRVNLRVLYASPRTVESFSAALLLGIPFGLSTCPACTPLILPVMVAAAGSGDATMGAVLLFVFGIARGTPIVIVAAAAGFLARVRTAMLWVPQIERIGGALLLLAATAFAYQGAVYAGWLQAL